MISHGFKQRKSRSDAQEENLNETKSPTMTFFEMFYFLFKSFVKVELS